MKLKIYQIKFSTPQKLGIIHTLQKREAPRHLGCGEEEETVAHREQRTRLI